MSRAGPAGDSVAGGIPLDPKEVDMPAKKLIAFLDKEEVPYVMIRHSPAYTMPEIAHRAHVPGKMVAKTVVLKVGGKMAMAVVPSNTHVDLDSLREMTHAKTVELATEAELEAQFPGCELGAMPPFGNLYGMDVYVAPELSEHEDIAFNSGTHTELVRLPYKDFDRLVRPKVLMFTSPT